MLLEKTVKLCQDLLKIESVSPDSGQCLQRIADFLMGLGFVCEIKEFDLPDSDYIVSNLYATIGSGSNNVCFLGHSDVVPTGDIDSWICPPFAGQIVDAKLYGRGSVDMKGAIAAYLNALSEVIKKHPPKSDAKYWQDKKLSLLITGDEEAQAINGTKPMIEYLVKEKGEAFDAFIVGEPTSQEYIGDTIKIGRRGSINLQLELCGTQGHVAYPQLALNPISTMVDILREIKGRHLDNGDDHFAPSNLEITSIDVDNYATNVIPENIKAKLNIRFNTNHSAKSLYDWINQVCIKHCSEDGDHSNKCKFKLSYTCTAHPFISKNPHFAVKIQQKVTQITQKPCKLDTGGGTSDARFVHQYAPVIELGLLNKTAHQIDEHVAIDDLLQLSQIYKEIIS